MSHHSDKPFGGMSEEIAKLLGDDGRQKAMRKQLLETVGPTGAFPDGKLAEHDEGELAFAVGTRDGKVVLDFGTAVKSIGFGPDQAQDLAEQLLKHAARAGGTLRPIRVKF